MRSLTISTFQGHRALRHEEHIELRLFCFDRIAGFSYVLEEGQVFLDKIGLGVWLNGLELGDNPIGCILTPSILRV